MRTGIRFVLVLAALLIHLPAAWAQEDTEPAATSAPRVSLETSLGTIVIELDAENAPISTENFLQYAETGFFGGTIFHRVIPGFMVQGGGFSIDMKKKDTRAAIQNESDNGLGNDRGTIAMARTGDPHSATAQFYINLVDNDALNHKGKAAGTPFDDKGKTTAGWGYAVFGKVVEGMDVVDAIAKVPTSRRGRYNDVPVEPVIIEKATVSGR